MFAKIQRNEALMYRNVSQTTSPVQTNKSSGKDRRDSNLFVSRIVTRVVIYNTLHTYQFVFWETNFIKITAKWNIKKVSLHFFTSASSNRRRYLNRRACSHNAILQLTFYSTPPKTQTHEFRSRSMLRP